MLIYVSCPYSAETKKQRLLNVFNAIEAGIQIMQKRHSPLIPTLMHYVDEIAIKNDIKFTWDDYMRVCLDMLEKCDAMLYMGSSKGCDVELEYAKQCGIPVYYSVEEIDEANNID